MPKFAANLSMLYNEVDFLDRFRAAADAGFQGVEYLFPYDFTKDELAGRLADNGLEQVLHNLPAGDWGGGERGIGCLPDRVGEFQDGVGRAIDYARALGCPRVNCLAGIAPDGADPGQLTETFVANLRFAAGKLGEAGIQLLIEPINTRDIPGFFLTGTGQANAVIDAVGSDNLALQYDIYHMQIMEGDLAPTNPGQPGADRPHATRRQPGPARARDRRDQLPVPVRLHRPDSDTRAGSGASTNRLRRRRQGLSWVAPYVGARA